MTLDEYQKEALRTNRTGGDWLAMHALGLTGEAGEVADLIKKVVGHGHALDRDKLILELGDVLWYVAALGNDVDATLDEIAAANVAKLKARYPDGFRTADSLARRDEAGADRPQD